MCKYKMFLIGILSVFFICYVAGCAGMHLKDMGRFEPSMTATANFEELVIHDDYNYFISGSDVYPVMIFGLKKDCRMHGDDELWKKIDARRETLSELVSNMQRRLTECCSQSPHGFDILDNHGLKIGEGYAMLGLITGIEIKEDGKVAIYPPIDTDDVKRYQDRLNGRAR